VTETPEVRVTLQRAAEITGLGVDSLRLAIRRREISVTYPTRRAMVKMSEIAAWLNAGPDKPGGAR
jgi:hypothetical protein